MAKYGVSKYGVGVYGPITTNNGCFPYDKFVFSGVNLGVYTFDQNPVAYDPFRRRDTRIYSTVMSTNPTVDEDYVKIPVELHWDFMTQDMWDAILPYARKYRDGSSEDIYFWDGAISGMQGVRVRVEGLKGEVRGGYEPVSRHNVSLKLRVATA